MDVGDWAIFVWERAKTPKLPVSQGNLTFVCICCWKRYIEHDGIILLFQLLSLPSKDYTSQSHLFLFLSHTQTQTNIYIHTHISQRHRDIHIYAHAYRHTGITHIHPHRHTKTDIYEKDKCSRDKKLDR